MGIMNNRLRSIRSTQSVAIAAATSPKAALRHLRTGVECQLGASARSPQHVFAELQTSEEQKASFALRYQVYCRERGFLPEDNYRENKEESDCHDHGNCLHFGALNAQGELAGTNRLIVSDKLKLPLRAWCEITDEATLKAAGRARVAEISRLAICRGDGRGSNSELVLGLYKVMYQASKLNDVEYWFAAMERSLVRLLGRLHFHFEPIGPAQDYYGEVRPYVARIADIEKAVQTHNPQLFEEFNRELPAQMGEWDCCLAEPA